MALFVSWTLNPLGKPLSVLYNNVYSAALAVAPLVLRGFAPRYGDKVI